jgi:hypothetical protein
MVTIVRYKETTGQLQDIRPTQCLKALTCGKMRKE